MHYQNQRKTKKTSKSENVHDKKRRVRKCGRIEIVWAQFEGEKKAEPASRAIRGKDTQHKKKRNRRRKKNIPRSSCKTKQEREIASKKGIWDCSGGQNVRENPEGVIPPEKGLEEGGTNAELQREGRLAVLAGENGVRDEQKEGISRKTRRGGWGAK